ncbi:MAG: hypothetical protein HYS06_05225 [Methylocystis sp.]|nr:hypothetical protein [Methylocystis sp.]
MPSAPFAPQPFTAIRSERQFAGLCVGAAAAAAGVAATEITAPSRGRARAAKARQLAAYLLHVAFGASLSSCGRALARDRASIRHACAKIEDARDAIRVDLALTHLERALLVQRDMLAALADGPYVHLQRRPTMTKRVRQTNETTVRTTRRLLQALNEPGARGVRSAVQDQMIAVLAPRNGVTVVRANAPVAAAEHALTQGLVRWEGENGASRLELTEAGRAHVRRLAADSASDGFRAQHSPIEPRCLDKGAAPVLCNEGESPLAWLARRKDRDGRPFLAPSQIEAGERLRRDVTQAHMLQRVTANWEAPIASSRRAGEVGVHVSQIAIDARRRLARAFDVVGPDFAGLLTDVCGYLKGLEIVEAERGWPPRSAKVVLRIALARLALHYGLASEAHGPARAPMLHWGAQDYRPDI